MASTPNVLNDQTVLNDQMIVADAFITNQTYIGRFAPSPTGPLHFGSLVTAVASYLEAKIRNGIWLLRIEDLDKPREIAGCSDGILQTLDYFGFEWQGEVVYQSQRQAAYIAAFEGLKAQGMLYPCTCSRKEIADSAMHGIDGLVYPNTCKYGLAPTHQTRTTQAWRVHTTMQVVTFHDQIQGNIRQILAAEVGDFVIKRADGLFAYQLAVVVDDAEQGVTHVVRGADLLDSTPRQIYLQQLLQHSPPQYAHIPVATNQDNEKLSKQTLAQPLNIEDKAHLLWQALRYLGQQPPAALAFENISVLWQWAAQNWQLHKVPRQRAFQFNPVDIAQR